MPDDAHGRGGGSRGDTSPLRRADRGLAAAGEPRLNARGLAPLVAGAVLAALLVSVFPPEVSLPVGVASLCLALAGFLAGVLRPAAATLGLAAAAPLLAGLPRAFGAAPPVPLLPLVAVAILGGILSRRRWNGEESALPASVSRWGGAFLLVAAASALASAVRGETLYVLLRGGASPVTLNGLGMTAAERSREAVVLLAVLASIWAALDAFAAVAREARGRERLAAALAVGIAAVSVAVLSERVAPLPLTQERWSDIGRFSGPASDPNALGVAVALAAPLLAGILLARRGMGAALAAGLGLLLLPLVLEHSGSRTGLLLLAAAALAAGIGLVREGGKPRRLALGAAAAGLASVALVVAIAPRGGPTAKGGLVERIGASLSTPSTALLASHRPMFWGAAFDMVSVEPLSGVGLGGFPFEFPRVHEKRSGTPARATDNATNLLLDVAAESGLPALLLALGAVVPLLSRAAGAAFGGSAGDPVGRAAGASLVGFAVASLTGSHLRFPEVALLVAGAAALLPEVSAAGTPAEVFRPRRLLQLLAGSGVLAALVSTAVTASPAAPFREERWAGLHDRGRPRRWTSANVFRRVTPGERRLRLTLANERPDQRPVVMRVRVDDVPAGAVAIPPGPVRVYRVDYPRDARVVRLTFDPVFVPRELTGRNDPRTLGVRLHADGGEP